MDLEGSPYIGLFALATDEFCILGSGAEHKAGEIEEALGTNVTKASIVGTPFLGLFCVGNSRCILVPRLVYEKEVEVLKEITDNVVRLESRFTALGNLILANDRGAIVSRLLRNEVEVIESSLGVKSEVYLGNDRLIGAIALATNRGCVLGKEIEREAVEQIERVLGVKVGFSTANFGSPYVRASLIANSRGFISGSLTTGVELEELRKALGF